MTTLVEEDVAKPDFGTRKIILGIALAGMLVAVVVAQSFRSFKQIEGAAAERANSHTIISKAGVMLSEMIDAETGQRGYLLTGDMAYLEPYFSVRNNLNSHLRELHQLTTNVEAQKYLDAVAPLLDAKMAELIQSIELRRNNDAIGALVIVTNGRGKLLMDSIRTEMQGYIAIENKLLRENDALFQSKMRFLLYTIVSASMSALLFVFVFIYLIYQRTQQRFKDLAHLGTQKLLAIQEQTNKNLQQVNDALVVSEEKLAVTLSSIGDAVIATDAAGRVTFLNPQAEQFTGWKLSEASDRPIDEIFHIISKKTRQQATIPVADALEHGTIQGLANHTILIARDGSELDIADSCAPIRDREGKVVGAVLVFRNVSGEYAAQQALQETNVALENARAMAEKANLAKSDFLSSMSHELRSPLNAILGFAQLLNSDLPPPTPSQKASIEQILRAGWYLLELINEILDLAVIESGKVSLSAEPVSLADVMFECQEMMDPQAHKSGIKLTFPQLADFYFVHADRVRLKQILINLVSNAIKYNRPGGSVDVCCVQVEPGRTRISVKDSGAGLSPEKLVQLFQPFNRLGKEGGSVEGTGIGLVMSRRLVELMGGVMGVDSAVGVGSVFWFELSSASAPKLVFPITEFNSSGKIKVQSSTKFYTLLYIEDNPANLKLVQELIARRPDMRLLTAIDAELGIELARNHQPEMILMDINLPGISGIHALRILHNDPLTAHIPVLAISANAMPSDIRKGLEAGFCSYLTKPINVDEFMEALDEVLIRDPVQSYVGA